MSHEIMFCREGLCHLAILSGSNIRYDYANVKICSQTDIYRIQEGNNVDDLITQVNCLMKQESMIPIGGVFQNKQGRYIQACIEKGYMTICSNIDRYCILEAEDLEAILVGVNALITSENMSPLGGISQNQEGNFIQALVKSE